MVYSTDELKEDPRMARERITEEVQKMFSDVDTSGKFSFPIGQQALSDALVYAQAKAAVEAFLASAALNYVPNVIGLSLQDILDHQAIYHPHRTRERALFWDAYEKLDKLKRVTRDNE